MSSTLDWFKSSYSAEQGECVEIAAAPAAVHIRDSKDTTRPALTVSPGTWTAFLPHAVTTRGPDGCPERSPRA
ncbi:DUF397 domain-containing protein [Streptomyces sp. NBC_00859]|uniref:DUF397 domain-containing protein n=1 Tax=Streptomyces sp. NBC_00859 TaxID=2903682 RepID=UPI003869FD57|nr:DUF397 domain-containing protein [Streptomyces sp. NBC_00859]